MKKNNKEYNPNPIERRCIVCGKLYGSEEGNNYCYYLGTTHKFSWYIKPIENFTADNLGF